MVRTMMIEAPMMAAQSCRLSEQHREDTMSKYEKKKRGIQLLITGLISLFAALGIPAGGWSQTINMVDYTNYPMFLNKTGPTNILFVVDLGNSQLPAAYGAYPISAKNGTVTVSSGNVRYASNVNMVDPGGGNNLVSSSDDGVSVNSATTSAPSDAFNPNKEYYGFFDPYRCYAAGSPHFVYGSKKVDGSGNPSVSVQCATSQWDGNFLNWLAMRKKEVTMQALIGGKTLSASSNTDGTANTMAGEDKTGEDGLSPARRRRSRPRLELRPRTAGPAPPTGDPAGGAAGALFPG